MIRNEWIEEIERLQAENAALRDIRRRALWSVVVVFTGALVYAALLFSVLDWIAS